MAGPLAGQAWLSAPASRAVLAALAAGGQEVRFVGGCVRDGLLGLANAGQDLDLATPERPEQVMALLQAAGLPALPTGIAHGTVTTLVDGQPFEITTLRQDVACDGRHAAVEFTADFRADAARRDFTINAMSCDGAGRLFDYFGGRVDLAAGRVRFVGDAATRVAEDYLRVLRFFRFFARYGRLPADPSALAACAAGVPGLAQLSGERIRAEMVKLLAAPAPLPALQLMAETAVLAAVLSTERPLARLAGLLQLAPDATDPWLRLAALLRPPPPAPGLAAAIATRWRLSRPEAERLQQLVELPAPTLAASPAEHRQALYRLGHERFRELALLTAAEQPDDPATRAALATALARAAAWQPVSLPVTGQDLLDRGLAPGPRIGQLLRALEAWWLARDMQPDRAACLAQLAVLLAADPPPPATGRP